HTERKARCHLVTLSNPIMTGILSHGSQPRFSAYAQTFFGVCISVFRFMHKRIQVCAYAKKRLCIQNFSASKRRNCQHIQKQRILPFDKMRCFFENVVSG
ncbi:MAG: hypothetical protein J1F25_06360, partial [Prevotellaceae bacterium]|nr:hypothetical protein [Prevotellaceae bacterium]